MNDHMNETSPDQASNGGSKPALTLEIIDSVSELSSGEWNALVSAKYPFLRYEFLDALERTGCVSMSTGWIPQHIVLRNQKAPEKVRAVAPMYLKYHSYGEFIFDWAWARHYDRLGIQYYPKLVLQTPFTPLTGPKILTAPDTDRAPLKRAVIDFGRNIVKQDGISSIHWLFVPDDEFDGLKGCGYASRAGTIQYVWNNHGYKTMDDFLVTLSSRKRKKIRAERKSVAQQGITIEAIEGDALTAKHWEAFEMFYAGTIMKYFSAKYLSLEFFKMIGKTMPRNLVLFLAMQQNRPVGASFCLRGEDSLYGRYWGSLEEFPNLHFETCYYSAIEYCIANSISTYDAGTQGEHKLQRGFLACLGRSAHLLRHEKIQTSIEHFAASESSKYRKYRDELNAHSAYRRT